MLRATLEDAAVAAAKAFSHAEVEPRHVVYAISRRLSDRPELEAIKAAARAALDPHGSATATPSVGDAARAMLERCVSEEAAVAVALEAGGDAREGGADGTAAGGVDEPKATSKAPPKAHAQAQPPPEAPAPEPREAVADVLAELDALIGLATVKEKVRQVIAVVRANRERAAAGMPGVNPSLHLVFTGSAGTGKTTVARLVARLYAAAGALEGARCVEVSRGDLIAGYVGQTALKTQHVIDGAIPGVLFIDEAYALTASHHVDYANECIATLVKNMEDRRAELAVIAAGYSEPMADFIASNPGLRSRFKTFIEFPDYTSDELVAIFRGFAGDAQIGLGEGVEERAAALFDAARSAPDFGNARYARSIWEQAYASMATRAAADGTVELAELGEIAAGDLPDAPSGLGGRQRSIGFRD